MSHLSSGLQSKDDRKHEMSAYAAATPTTPPETESARSAEAFWRPNAVTPTRVDDASKFKLTLRDVLVLLIGSIGMYGAQLATQYGIRSDIRDLTTSVQAYQTQQREKNEVMQRQIDEWRSETKLNRVNIDENQRALAELKGILLGA